MTARIHPTALVHPDARLGDGVVIGPFCHVDGAVTIGDGTVLRSYVRIYDHTVLGSNCEVFEHAVLGPEPQDRGFKGEVSYVSIGDRTVLRENVTVHRASGEGNVTSVGSDCLIMEGVHLAHNVMVADRVTISSKSGLAGYVSIGEGTVIGGLAGFHQFIRVGAFCMVGGASKNSQDVPPFTLVDGAPSRIYGLNSVGLRRNGFSAEDRSLIKACYRKIYHGGFLLREGVEAARRDLGGHPLAERIFDFFTSGTRHRGFCPWPAVNRED